MKSFDHENCNVPFDWRQCTFHLNLLLSVNEKYIIEDLDFLELKHNPLCQKIINEILDNWIAQTRFHNSILTYFNSNGLYNPNTIANLIFVMYWKSLKGKSNFSSPEAELLNRINFVITYKTDGLSDKNETTSNKTPY